MSDLGLGAVRQLLNMSSFPILVLANGSGSPNPSLAVTEFQITDGVGPNGNLPPDWVIAGPNTTLRDPYDVAVYEGQIYVLDKAPDSIKVFPLAKGGDLKPTFSISGNNTALLHSSAIAFDKWGNLFVAGNDQVTVYHAGARGDVAPTRRIAGPDTGLSGPTGIAVDQTGKIYVANGNAAGHGSITVHAPDANGNAAPVAQLGGPQTRLGQPQALALDTAGRIYVTNNPLFDPDSIVVFASGANGNVAPTAIINSGPTTGLYVQPDITIGAGDLIYVVNGQWGTAVSVFPAGANGDVVPLATLSGGATLLRGASIAIGHRWEPKLLTRLLRLWSDFFPPLALKVPPFPGPDPGPR